MGRCRLQGVWLGGEEWVIVGGEGKKGGEKEMHRRV